jgi:hydroxyacylglutathione hydrolase
MLFKRIYDEDLAQASYFIGCQQTGEAIVVDPRRDVAVYLDEAKAQGMTIKAATETHIHADYLSGSRELAAATGATLYLSDEGGEEWSYRFAHEGLKHGDTIKVGNLTLEARHTPGHTPEHLSFLLTDGAATDAPGFYLTGDFVFVGDLGRPDLLDESGIGKDTREPMARQLFKSLKDEFWSLPDFVQVWPGHGAGSACGKALGAVPSSTVGYEKLVSWWAPFVDSNDEEGFVRALLEGQPDAPLYFSRMKRMNRAGPPLLGERGTPEELDPDTLKGIGDSLILIDTRPKAVFDKDAVKGALHIPIGKSFVTYAAYVIDPERDERDIVLFAENASQAATLRDRLSYVGIDNVIGYVTHFGSLEREPVKSVAPEALDELENPFILDIRTQSEFDAGHLPNAHRIHGGRVMWLLDELPKNRPVVTYCRSGARNTVVSSALRAAGFDNVVELEGSYLGWKKAQERRVSA